MWLTVSDGYRESQQMGRASLLLKARTNKMLMKMLMLRRMLVLVLPMMWLLVVVGIIGAPQNIYIMPWTCNNMWLG